MKATGRLRHKFEDGIYSAHVSLRFPDEDSAQQALPALGAGWERLDHGAGGRLDYPGVCRAFDIDELDVFKRQIAEWGFVIEPDGYRNVDGPPAWDAGIDSVAYIVEFGPMFGPIFTVDIPTQTEVQS